MVIIGNGESRKSIKLNSIQSEIVGCNAVFRDCIVDHLVCVDRRMLRESIGHENTKHAMIYTRPDWLDMYTGVFEVPKLFYEGKDRPDQPMHWGAGQYALLVGIENCNEGKLDIIGYDLYGKHGKVNNVYKGTLSYNDPDTDPVDPRYWIYQNKKIFEHFSNIKLNYWVDEHFELPPSWKGIKNLKIKNIKKW